MGTSIAYEIQCYRNGKWEIQAIVDDRDRAIKEAHQLDGSEFSGPVRVMEERYDPVDGVYSSRLVFLPNPSTSVELLSAPQKSRRGRSPTKGGGVRTGIQQGRLAVGSGRSRVYLSVGAISAATVAVAVSLLYTLSG